jgi:phosphomannomutase
MAWHGKSLGELLSVLHAEFGEFHYGRIDLDVKPGQKEKVIAYFANEKTKRVDNWDVTRRENMDGIKLYLGDTGWVMLRPSGTENLLRIYSETSRPETTKRVLQAAVAAVNAL